MSSCGSQPPRDEAEPAPDRLPISELAWRDLSILWAAVIYAGTRKRALCAGHERQSGYAHFHAQPVLLGVRRGQQQQQALEIFNNGPDAILADNDAAAAILAVANQTATNNFFNGNDAIELLFDGVVMDSIGQVGFDPGGEWGTGLVSTQDNTLRRLSSVLSGDTISNNPFDPSNEWTGFDEDTFGGLGSHQLQSSAVPEASTLAVWVLLGLCCSGSRCWRVLRFPAPLADDF